MGWLGAVGAYIALDVAVATGRDAELLRGLYGAMDLIVRSVIVPLAVATVVTGVVVSLGTRWGLFRHYWVVISFLLTVGAMAVLLVEAGAVAHLADAADRATSSEQVRGLGHTLPHSVGGAIVLLVVLMLNIHKPQGLTRYGWRKQQSSDRATT